MKKKKIILRALEFYISHRIFRLKNHAKSQDALRVKINVPRIKVNAYSQCITKNKPASWSIPFIENWVCSGHRIGNVKKINGSSVSLIRTVNYLKDNWENSHMKNWRWDLYKTSGNPLGLCTWGQRNHWNYSDKSMNRGKSTCEIANDAFLKRDFQVFWMACDTLCELGMAILIC